MKNNPTPDTALDYSELANDIKRWSLELGFQQTGITDIDLSAAEGHFLDWLNAGFHGEMDYMEQHGTRRSRPAELLPGTTRVISVCMDYFPNESHPADETLDDPLLAYISRYALGRDYHKLMRRRLQKLAEKITAVTGPMGYRAFVDSAPVLEKPLAQKAGLGWIGKHTNLINKQHGSWFFLGELLTNLPLPIDSPAQDHCGSCKRCIDICPTNAIVAPYKLDARRCISYLTIELRGSIPTELRPLIGNRIYGCDDCQLVCPWNRFAQLTDEADFSPRHELDSAQLIRLFSWNEQAFLKYTEGSAIRRIGHQRWLRNIAIALGNALSNTLNDTPDNTQTRQAIIKALQARLDDSSALVREHVQWALQNHQQTVPST